MDEDHNKARAVITEDPKQDYQGERWMTDHWATVSHAGSVRRGKL